MNYRPNISHYACSVLYISNKSQYLENSAGIKIRFAGPSDKMSDDFEFGSDDRPFLQTLDLLLQISAVHYTYSHFDS